MSNATIPTLGAMLLQLALGLTVFLANRHRLANQSFLLLSLAIDAWLGSLYLAFIASTPQLAEFAIRQASASGAAYLAMLNLLRLSVRQKQQSWPTLLGKSRVWLIVMIGVVVLCQTKVFLRGAEMPHNLGGAPIPIYAASRVSARTVRPRVVVGSHGFAPRPRCAVGSTCYGSNCDCYCDDPCAWPFATPCRTPFHWLPSLGLPRNGQQSGQNFELSYDSARFAGSICKYGSRGRRHRDRKSTRLNSSHSQIS